MQFISGAPMAAYKVPMNRLFILGLCDKVKGICSALSGMQYSGVYCHMPEKMVTGLKKVWFTSLLYIS